MQLPLIKDGIVVNVVEFERGTICCSKAELKAMQAEEEAAYNAKAAEWRAQVGALEAEIQEAETRLSGARKAAQEAKEAATAGKGNAEQKLRLVLSTDAEVKAWEENLAALRARPMPARPTFVRPVRWIIPEGHSIGKPGGNIGDIWDGAQYVRPAPAAEAVTSEAKVNG